MTLHWFVPSVKMIQLIQWWRLRYPVYCSPIEITFEVSLNIVCFYQLGGTNTEQENNFSQIFSFLDSVTTTYSLEMMKNWNFPHIGPTNPVKELEILDRKKWKPNSNHFSLVFCFRCRASPEECSQLVTVRGLQ